MMPETTDVVAETEQAQAGGMASRPRLSTERVHLHRERRRCGLTPLTIEIYDEEVDDLVDHGVLPADQRADRGAVAKALGQILDRAFRLLRGGWLPKG